MSRKPTDQTVPLAVRELAQRMLVDVPPRTCGTTRSMQGWFIETHTLGCRNEANTAEED